MLFIRLGTHFCHSISSHTHILPAMYHFSSYLTYFPSIVGALIYASSFSLRQKSVTQNMKMCVPNVIDNTGHRFLPFKLISHPYTTSYQFSGYSIVQKGVLDTSLQKHQDLGISAPLAQKIFYSYAQIQQQFFRPAKVRHTRHENGCPYYTWKICKI